MIRTDSRKVQKGDTFVALPGISSNGDQYIGKAVQAGAVRIICGKDSQLPESLPPDVECLRVEDPRACLEQLLQETYAEVIRGMTLIAVTGTNGKTTTCYLTAQALNRLGRNCGYIGTIGFYLGEKVRDLPNTSVDLCSLYELLLEAHEKGYDTVALEASSQGLDMGRLRTLSFDLAVFTNLTEDHLDYHKTMENYAAAKAKLFRQLKPEGTALVNCDDPGARYFILPENRTRIYGIHAGEYRALRFSFGAGTDLDFTCPDSEQEYHARTRLIGRYNVYNTLAVIGILQILGYAPEKVCEGIRDLKAPNGRCDVIPYRKNCCIVIDYAHTPDAVENIIETAKEFTAGDLYVVFGCTGDREREKRPVMTRLVLQNCTHAVITNDDVHTEPEQRIVEDMLEGNTLENYEVCLDRKEAIRRGISLLESGDTLLILGKGHEEYIIMNGYRIPHNDRKAVEEILSE
ncbi:MAG: UDP-N-acetylmuramoyl-L-alanyl-D-glutamate--2,6-diaminopimelate ligase [Parasporobacterium sp.]|nr:UDP-N-acetylmuramoyl-L-alanyl-D-glutamate--2,6-diaminopimelate ligase [Parasporobacterium sp.]